MIPQNSTEVKDLLLLVLLVLDLVLFLLPLLMDLELVLQRSIQLLLHHLDPVLLVLVLLLLLVLLLFLLVLVHLPLLLMVLLLMLLLLVLLLLSLVPVHSMSLWWYHPSIPAASCGAQGMLGRLWFPAALMSHDQPFTSQ